MMMLPASRIKPCPAPRTLRLALHILPNGHLPPASPAQNRPRIPLRPRPNRNRMPRQRLMAILASPIHPATSHLDSHNIHRRVPMRTPRLPIHLDPAHLWCLPDVLNRRSLPKTRSNIEFITSVGNVESQRDGDEFSPARSVLGGAAPKRIESRRDDRLFLLLRFLRLLRFFGFLFFGSRILTRFLRRRIFCRIFRFRRCSFVLA